MNNTTTRFSSVAAIFIAATLVVGATLAATMLTPGAGQQQLPRKVMVMVTQIPNRKTNKTGHKVDLMTNSTKKVKT